MGSDRLNVSSTSFGYDSTLVGNVTPTTPTPQEFGPSTAFGFSFVTEDEIKAYEKDKIASQRAVIDKTSNEATQLRKKLDALHGAIKPFLKNMMEHPERQYILWPNRAEKIAEFMAIIDKIVQE